MKRLIGYRCPSDPKGMLIPPASLIDPCGRDVPVYEDDESDRAPTGADATTGSRALGPESTPT